MPEEVDLSEDASISAGADYESAQTELEQLIPSWALAFRNKEIVAKKAAEWLVDKFPNIFDHATWVSIRESDIKDFLDGEGGYQDKGLQINIYQKQVPISKAKKLTLQFGGLLGFRTAGLNISAPVYTTDYGIVVSIGIGAVSPYDDFGKDIKPVISFAAKVPLDNLFG